MKYLKYGLSLLSLAGALTLFVPQGTMARQSTTKATAKASSHTSQTARHHSSKTTSHHKSHKNSSKK